MVKPESSPVGDLPVWHLYVLRCGDGSLYCGITTEVARRLTQHREGKGARYTRSRGPLKLEASWAVGDRSAASKAEWVFKQFSRTMKERLLKARELRVLDQE